MRVIAGALKGRRLKPPGWDGLRPTSDKLRETLFNILAPRVAGARVLDGYAGTGALGIEALSRGARAATFVDDDRRAAALIAENVAHCGIADHCVIIRATVARALERLRAESAFEAFDIVLLDPPYALEHSSDLDAILRAAGSLLARDGIVVLEHARRALGREAGSEIVREVGREIGREIVRDVGGETVPDASSELVRTRRVLSGDSALSFYELR